MSYSYITITSGTQQFTCNRGESIELELELNQSEYGHEWSYIGDALYNFGIRTVYAETSLVVSPKQWDFLYLLHLKLNCER